MQLGHIHIWLLVLGLCFVSLDARAEKVFMQRPDPNDAVLTEAFNRLQAELRLASFDVDVSEYQSNTPRERLRQRALQSGAFATVVFARSERTTSVDVWISGRATGSSTTRTLELADVEDAPRVLALRAVDFVRSALRDSDVRDSEPPLSPPAPLPEPERSTSPLGPVERRERAIGLRFGAEAALMGPAALAYGPALGVGYRSRDFQIGLSFTGPSLGAEWRADEGTVTSHQELLLVEGRWELARFHPFTLAPTLGTGAWLLTARGEAEPPLVSRSDSVWAFAAAPGAALKLALASDLFLDVSGRALFLLPRPGLRIDENSTLLPRPQFSLGVALGVEF